MLLKSRLPKSMSVPPTFPAAFFRDLWTPSTVDHDAARASLAEGRPAFDARLADAWTRRDIAYSLAALEKLEASGELSPENARRLWSARLMIQQWDDALRLLEDPRFAADRSADDWLDLACARAAARPWATSLAAVREALALNPQHGRALELEGALQRWGAYQGAGAIVEWGPLAGLVDVLTDLHRYDEAAGALGDFLIRHGDELSSEQQDLAVERARTLCRVLDPLGAAGLIQALGPVFTRRGLAETFEWSRQALGAPEDKAAQARPGFGEHYRLEACVAQAFAAQGKWKTATSTFGRPAALPDDPFGCLPELARCVGRAVGDQVRPRFVPAPVRRKIVDVFRFFDELMLLQLKLEEMAPWVDRFLILEAPVTFTGGPKPLLYEQNKAAFAPFADKIVHHLVDFPDWADSPWAREFYQRDAALETLSRFCGPEDLVFVSDADEIVDRTVIESFQGEYAALGMPVFRYFFNLRLTYRGQATYGAVCRAKYFDRIGLSQARIAFRTYSRWEKLPDAGWHFTSIKDASGLFAKYQGYSHVQYAKAGLDELADELDRIRQKGGRDGYERCELDENLPRAVRDNLDRISDFIL